MTGEPIRAGAAPADGDGRIPVVVVSGFLGSGKSTFINRLLSGGGLADTAVVVNELGAAGIDHHLLRIGEDRIRLLEGGCVCCSLRGGLADTLQDLFLQAVRRQIPRFSRVLMETTGLADPGPIVFTLRHDPFLAERYVYAGALVVIDAELGLHSQASQPEWMRQLAFADRIVLSKTDRAAPHAVAALEQALDRLAPGVPRSRGEAAGVAHLDLEGMGPYAGRRGRGVASWLGASCQADRDGEAGYGAGGAGGEGRPALAASLHPATRVVVVPAAGALAAGTFLAGLAGLQESHGEGLLRIKGIVRFASQPGSLQVFHGVHGQRYPLASLPDDGSVPCAVVLIARGPHAAALEAGLRGLVAAAGGGPSVADVVR